MKLLSKLLLLLWFSCDEIIAKISTDKKTKKKTEKKTKKKSQKKISSVYGPICAPKHRKTSPLIINNKIIMIICQLAGNPRCKKFLFSSMKRDEAPFYSTLAHWNCLLVLYIVRLLSFPRLCLYHSSKIRFCSPHVNRLRAMHFPCIFLTSPKTQDQSPHMVHTKWWICSWGVTKTCTYIFW